ncbi:hypothetical protein SNE40_023748 [Patella caerulea]|uniref:Integrase catalytic domain-containing protein n=1 Tax=Patella caerulea TaxID=87958 RepID=A0AAN8IUG0_PATCE
MVAAKLPPKKVSRGVKANELGTVINGPEFLRISSNEWPITPNVSIDREDTELKKYHVRNAKILAAQLNQDNTLLDPRGFSSWTRLVMVTARILSPRIKWLKDLTTTIFRWPSHKRINEAKLYWIRDAQKDLDFDNRHIMKLEPIYDDTDQVYRVGGRIHNAPISYDIRHPYLLPKKSYISYLIALEGHKYSLHGGHLRTAAEIRKTYWIIGDINLSRQVVRQCVICIRYRGKTVEQRMAGLPHFRIKPCTPPFQTTIVDYLGPVNVKLNRNTVTKGYCAVFTCAVTRAVHLECVQDLSTAAFLQALERFISIRGAPGLYISDNATCFRGADNEIR